MSNMIFDVQEIPNKNAKTFMGLAIEGMKPFLFSDVND